MGEAAAAVDWGIGVAEEEISFAMHACLSINGDQLSDVGIEHYTGRAMEKGTFLSSEQDDDDAVIDVNYLTECKKYDSEVPDPFLNIAKVDGNSDTDTSFAGNVNRNVITLKKEEYRYSDSILGTLDQEGLNPSECGCLEANESTEKVVGDGALARSPNYSKKVHFYESDKAVYYNGDAISQAVLDVHQVVCGEKHTNGGAEAEDDIYAEVSTIGMLPFTLEKEGGYDGASSLEMASSSTVGCQNEEFVQNHASIVCEKVSDKNTLVAGIDDNAFVGFPKDNCHNVIVAAETLQYDMGWQNAECRAKPTSVETKGMGGESVDCKIPLQTDWRRTLVMQYQASRQESSYAGAQERACNDVLADEIIDSLLTSSPNDLHCADISFSGGLWQNSEGEEKQTVRKPEEQTNKMESASRFLPEPLVGVLQDGNVDAMKNLAIGIQSCKSDTVHVTNLCETATDQAGTNIKDGNVVNHKADEDVLVFRRRNPKRAASSRNVQSNSSFGFPSNVIGRHNKVIDLRMVLSRSRDKVPKKVRTLVRRMRLLNWGSIENLMPFFISCPELVSSLCGPTWLVNKTSRRRSTTSKRRPSDRECSDVGTSGHVGLNLNLLQSDESRLEKDLESILPQETNGASMPHGSLSWPGPTPRKEYVNGIIVDPGLSVCTENPTEKRHELNTMPLVVEGACDTLIGSNICELLKNDEATLNSSAVHTKPKLLGHDQKEVDHTRTEGKYFEYKQVIKKGNQLLDHSGEGSKLIDCSPCMDAKLVSPGSAELNHNHDPVQGTSENLLASSDMEAPCTGVQSEVANILDRNVLRTAWVCCDDCHKWRRIPAALVDFVKEANCRWACIENEDKAFADCSIPQEMSNADINAELELPDAYDDDNYANITSGEITYTIPEDSHPASWVNIRTNIFLNRSRKNQSIDEVMVCECKPPENGQVGCRDDCLNRILNIECVKGTCPCGDFCSNQQFQKRNYAQLQWCRCGRKGFGLQLLENVSEGQFLIEYVGEVLDLQTYESRQRLYASRGQIHYYFMALNGGEVIDACMKGNLGRFINHSCNPNCRTEKWIVNGEVCIGFFAAKDIKKGEELTFNYNYVRVSGEAAQKCFCGSPECQGFIGGDPFNGEPRVQNLEMESNSEEMSKSGYGIAESCREESPDHQIAKSDKSRAVLSPLVSDHSQSDYSKHSPSRTEEDPDRTPVHISRTNYESVDTSCKFPSQKRGIANTGFCSESSLQEHSLAPVKCFNPQRLQTTGVHLNALHSTGKTKMMNAHGKSLVSREGKVFKDVSGQHLLGVEGKLNGLLDQDGGINRKKIETNGYLKLLMVTAAEGENNGVSNSGRDICMILEALLKTKSRRVLTNIISKNGLQMLHNILKQNRSRYDRTPVLRKLVKVFGFLAEKGILSLELINKPPPCSGQESFRESMLRLANHNDIEVHRIARNFRDKWIPRVKCFPRDKFTPRDKCTPHVIAVVEPLDRQDNNMCSEHQDGYCCDQTCTAKYHNGKKRDNDAILCSNSIDYPSLLTSAAAVAEDPGLSHAGLVGSNCTVGGKRKCNFDGPSSNISFSPSPVGLSTQDQPQNVSRISSPISLEPGEIAPDLEIHVPQRPGPCNGAYMDAENQVSNPDDPDNDIPPGFVSQAKVDPIPPGYGSNEKCDQILPAFGPPEIREQVPPGFETHFNTQQSPAFVGPPELGDQVPPGFEIHQNTQQSLPSFSDTSEAPVGYAQDRYLPYLPISYGIPVDLIHQFGAKESEAGNQCHRSTKTAVGIPFRPFPPLPHYPRGENHSSAPTQSACMNQMSLLENGVQSLGQNGASFFRSSNRPVGRRCSGPWRPQQSSPFGQRARPFTNFRGRSYPRTWNKHHRFERRRAAFPIRQADSGLRQSNWVPGCPEDNSGWGTW